MRAHTTIACSMYSYAFSWDMAWRISMDYARAHTRMGADTTDQRVVAASSLRPTVVSAQKTDDRKDLRNDATAGASFVFVLRHPPANQPGPRSPRGAALALSSECP